MTYAPADLTAILSYLNSKGAPWASLGCIAGPSDKASGGYHCGHDWLHALNKAPEDPGSDYSYTESINDRRGLTDAASAIDFAGADWWRPFTLWIVDQTARGASGTSDIREIIYTPDGKTVKRYDRLGIRTSGDSSHLFHTHISFFRNTEGTRDGAFLNLVKTFFEGTGGDFLMALSDQQQQMVASYVQAMCEGLPKATYPGGGTNVAPWGWAVQTGAALAQLNTAVATILTKLGATEAEVQQLLAKPAMTFSDEQLAQVAHDLAAEQDESKIQAALVAVLGRIGLVVQPAESPAKVTTNAHEGTPTGQDAE
jgi:hypothetical protein